MHCHCATEKSLCLFRQDIRLQPNLNPPNPLPLCHCNVTVSLKIQLNQISPNVCQILPMDCKFANAMSFEPLLCHFNHWDATQGEKQFMGPSPYSTASTERQGPRSFPSIEGNSRGPCPFMTIGCQLTNPVPLEPINSFNAMPIMPMDCQLANPVPLEPMECQSRGKAGSSVVSLYRGKQPRTVSLR